MCNFGILLWLTWDNFSGQGETSWTRKCWMMAQSTEIILKWPGTDLNEILLPCSPNQIESVDMIIWFNKWNKTTRNCKNWPIKKLVNCASSYFDQCPETSIGKSKMMFWFFQLTKTERFFSGLWAHIYIIKCCVLDGNRHRQMLSNFVQLHHSCW